MSACDILKARGVNRLCHFTKLQSLVHILSSEDGILASSSIRQDTKNVTDTERYDGELDYVCCSIEYPNSWFLGKAKQKDADRVFREWVVLYIDLEILKRRPAKFCPCNASKSSGAYISSDMEKVGDIFAPAVTTFRYPRSPQMLPCCPTDGQAEILIKGNIPRDFIIGIVTGNSEIAGQVYAMMKTCRINPIMLYKAPDVLSTAWSNLIKTGHRPDEAKYVWPEEE